MTTLLTERQPAPLAPVVTPSVAPSRPFRPVVVAPTYNNAATLPAILSGLAVLDLPILVVNDGSTDATAAILAAWAALEPAGRTVLTHPHNRGKAAALRTAFAHASTLHTHAVTIDTDGQLSPTDIPALLDGAADRPTAMVLGTRNANAADYPRRSRLGRWVSNRLVWIESGQTVADSQCGLRVYPLPFANLARCDAERFGFETEIITRATWAGLPIVQVPVACRYFPVGQRVSHFRPTVDSLRAIAMHGRLIATACNPLPFRRPIAKCSPNGHAPARGRSLPRRFLRWINPITAWRQARECDAGRTRFAAGFAIGVFIGAIPMYGAQTVLSLYIARRFRLHPMSILTGSNLSGPPIGVVLIAPEIAVGHLLRHGAWPDRTLFHAAGGLLIVEWVIGALFLGMLLAGCAFVAVDMLLRALPDRSGDDDDD